MAVSVVIPTLNEAAVLSGAIGRLRDQQPHEIIVVDGGSTDRTLQAASGADLVLQAAPGRASQMSVGAARATGDVLLFLHADCVVEPGALRQAGERLARPHVTAGCFTMRVGAEGPLYRWMEFVASARARLTGIIYGDQGLFVHRETFEKVG